MPTPRGAFVSADSRQDGGDPATRDQVRKIFLCGARGGLRGVRRIAAGCGGGPTDMAVIEDHRR